MKRKLTYPALLITDRQNQRYFHRQEFAAGAIYLTGDRTVYLSWFSGTPELPEDVEFQAISQNELGTAVSKLMEADGMPFLTVEASIPLNLYQLLYDAVGPVRIAAEEDPVAALREIKSDWELEQLRRASEITDRAFDAILDKIKPGVTELEIAAELEHTMRLLGSEESNRTIVAAGPNSAFPHHWPTADVIQAGDFVTMDYGCTVQGYHSDLTRTVVVGKASDRQKRIYDTVLKAQLAGVDALRAGKTGGELDGVARSIIDSTEFAGTFLHNLGHGIGLDIHEGTGLIKGSTGILRPGMVVSIEPGIYLEGYGGVRIEDIAVVRDQGAELLEHSDKRLIEL